MPGPPGQATSGLEVSFTAGSCDNLLPHQCKGTINGTKVYVVDKGVLTSEWVVYPTSSWDVFAAPGDSGGVIIDMYYQPIALIFAGNPKASPIFVKPLSFVLDRVELVPQG